MAAFRNRPIPGISSVILLAASIYCLASLSLPVRFQATSSYQSLITTIIFSFNIPILLAWVALGIFGSLAACAVSAGAVLLVSLRTGMSGYSIYILPFFLTSIVGYLNWRGRNGLSRSYGLRLEKLSEEINILSDDIGRMRNGISSLEGKMLRYSLLKEVVESLSATLSLEPINRMVIDRAVNTLGKPRRALLFLVDTQKEELRLAASNGEFSIKTKKGDVFDRWVMRHRRPIIIDCIGTDFRFSAGDIEEAKGSFGSLIAVPLISESKTIGILRMDSIQDMAFTQDDLRLLGIIADLGAVAIQNALLYSRTQGLAIRDALTGLFVRRYFLERFKEELARAARNKGSVSLLLLDIDHFKDYNDKYGHAAGALVLKFLARQLNSIVREGDIVVRYGGEEIGILLYGTDRKEAVREAERIRKAIKAKPIVFRRNENKITVSAGLSTYPEDAVLEEELIRIADERLYKAKALGRDRVCSE